MALKQLSYNFPISDTNSSVNVIYLGNLRLDNLNKTVSVSNLTVTGNITSSNLISGNLFSNNLISNNNLFSGNILNNSYTNSNIFGNILLSNYSNITNISNIAINNLFVSGNLNIPNLSISNITLNGNLVINNTSNINGNIIASSGISNIIPIGTIFPYISTSTLPYGYLLCNGQDISRTTYSQLFSVISTTYGIGDGATTFNIPDLRGAIPFGTSSTYTLGTTGGSTTQTLDTSTMPTHTHTGTLVASHSHNLTDCFNGRLPIRATSTTNRQGGGSRPKVNHNVENFPPTSNDVDFTTDTYSGNTSITGLTIPSSFSIMAPYIVLSYIIKVF